MVLAALIVTGISIAVASLLAILAAAYAAKALLLRFFFSANVIQPSAWMAATSPNGCPRHLLGFTSASRTREFNIRCTWNSMDKVPRMRSCYARCDQASRRDGFHLARSWCHRARWPMHWAFLATR